MLLEEDPPTLQSVAASGEEQTSRYVLRSACPIEERLAWDSTSWYTPFKRLQKHDVAAGMTIEAWQCS